MRIRLVLVLSIVIVIAAIGLYADREPGAASGDTIFGVTSGSLVRFNSADPGTVTTVGFLTGLQPDEIILAIDFRPATGQLYGVGFTGRLYTINTSTAVATQVGTPFSGELAPGTSMDFDPTDDEIRLVNENGSNSRLDPDTASFVGAGTNLFYDAGDPHAGEEPNVQAIAYTNNFVGANVTTLYGLDYTQGTLVRVGGVDGAPSPDTGALFTVGPHDVPVFFTRMGLDINSGGTAYAYLEAFVIGSQLHTIDLSTGDATLVGNIDTPAIIIDIAVSPAGAAPTPSPSPTPSPTPDGEPIWGDHNCSGQVDPVDALLTLRYDAGLSTDTGDCPAFGAAVPASGPSLTWGDVDCDGAINPVDALKLLRFDAGLEVQQEDGCPPVGDPVAG